MFQEQHRKHQVCSEELLTCSKPKAFLLILSQTKPLTSKSHYAKQCWKNSTKWEKEGNPHAWWGLDLQSSSRVTNRRTSLSNPLTPHNSWEFDSMHLKHCFILIPIKRCLGGREWRNRIWAKVIEGQRRIDWQLEMYNKWKDEMKRSKMSGEPSWAGTNREMRVKATGCRGSVCWVSQADMKTLSVTASLGSD